MGKTRQCPVATGMNKWLSQRAWTISGRAAMLMQSYEEPC